MSARAAALGRAIAELAPLRRRFALAVALGAGAISAAVALLAVSGTLISRAALRPEIMSLTALIVGVRALSLARALLRYLERLVSHDVALRALARLRVRFFARLVPLAPDARRLRGADALSRYVGDVETLQDLYLRALGPALIAAVVLATTGGFMLIVLPPAAPVLAVALLAAAVAVPALAAATSRRAGRRQAPARAALATELDEVVRGAAELALYGREADRVARVKAADAALVETQRRDAWVASASSGLSTLASVGAIVGVLACGVAATAAGRLDGVLLAAVVLVAMGAFEAVVPLPEAAARLSACATAAARLEEVTDAAPGVPEPRAPRSPPAAGALEARGVGVRFAGRDALALRDVDVRVAPGARVAVVGRSGAGKTTLARLLVRFRDPDAGAVSLGGVDVRELASADLRAVVRLDAQDAHLFTATLRANVALARPGADDAAIRDALRRAGLGPWLASLPAGLDTEVGEDGTEVSGGQRRRIALARALLADARFLVLDEPTAHLDPGGARDLLRALGEDRSDARGMLVITHGLDGLEAFDEVVVLDAGVVVERGRPGELVELDGAFAAMAAA